MPRKTHGKDDSREARDRLFKDVGELGRRFEEAVGAAVNRPEFREAVDSLRVSVRGAAEKLAEAAKAAKDSPEGEAFKEQAEKAARSGRRAGAGTAADLAKSLAAGLKTLAEELEGFAGRVSKKRK
ncbi:MAG: hypothetical protein KGL53_10680 [Elusimicrobia bacterium]|nr:hypothetical protein [Elusimicrobiota bacterium]